MDGNLTSPLPAPIRDTVNMANPVPFIKETPFGLPSLIV